MKVDKQRLASFISRLQQTSPEPRWIRLGLRGIGFLSLLGVGSFSFLTSRNLVSILT